MITKEKKGIMLRFLTSLLLALIVFGFAGCVAAKFFRLSPQAESNFEDLAKEIVEVAQSALPQTRPFVFIQDPDTYVYLVTDRIRKDQGLIWFDDRAYNLKYPLECSEGTCICLCQKLTEEDSFNLAAVRECEEFSCRKLPGVEITEGSEIAAYRRGKVDLQVAYKKGEGPRRQTVNIIKCAGKESYCKNKGEISVIFEWWDQQKAYEGIK